MRKKFFSLLTLLLAVCGGAWAQVSWPDANYLVIGPSSKTSSEAGITFTKSDTYSIQDFSKNGTSKFNGVDFTYGLKHESKTSTTFTTTAEATITVVQSTLVNNGKTMKLDSQELSAWTNATKTTYDGSTDSNNQNIYVYTIPNVASGTHTIVSNDGQPYLLYVGVTNTGAEAAVVDPTISLSGSTMTITCLTSNADIYYTTDGSEPTSEKNKYTGAVVLDNACTVRAIAIKDEDSSNIIEKECFIPYADALAVLQYSDGTADGTSWTADGYTLTAASTDIADASSFGTGVTAFKMTANEAYTLQVPEDVKVTRIVVVGKTWLEGTSTFAITGFTGTGSFYATTKDGDDYTRYIGSYSFTPDTELGYGATITMTPGGTQLGAYLVVYGQERKGPAEPEAALGTPITWDFSDRTAQSFGDNASYSFKATDETTEMRYTSKDSNDKIIAKSGSTSGYLKENGTTSSASAKDVDETTVIGKNRIIRLFVTGKGKLTINCNSSAVGKYTVYNSNANNTASDEGSALISSYTANEQSTEITATNGLWIETTSKGYITSIVWTPASDDIILTTTDNMAGWRAFYDASNNYSVDANTTVYVAASEPADGKITLTSITGVPAGVPVILHTSSNADNYKMTLTKATAGTYTYSGTNNLEYTTNIVSNVYRLGYGDEGIGFYPYSGTPTSGAVILNVSSASARALNIVFEDESTGIAATVADKNVKSNEVFNLAGQRVAQPTKGLYIINGKKVVLK